MPDDEPDLDDEPEHGDEPEYEDEFLAHWGMSLAEAIDFLRRLAARWEWDPEEANDLVFDFLLEQVIGRPFPVEDADNPRAYLRQMFWHFHIVRLRRRCRRPRTTDDDPEDAPTGSGEEDAVERIWFWGEVAALPPCVAQVIVLRLDWETFQEIRTWDEIGVTLAVTRDTAARRFARGMEIIRQRLQDGKDEEGP